MALGHSTSDSFRPSVSSSHRAAAAAGSFVPFGLAAIGGLFLVAGLAAIALLPESRTTIFVVFVFMSTVAPLAAAFLLTRSNHANDPLIQKATERALTVITAFLLCIALTLVGVAIVTTLARLKGIPWWSFAIAFPLSTLVVFRLATQASFQGNVAGRLQTWLVVSLSLMIFVYSPFTPGEPIPIGLADYALGAPKFFLWGLLGIAWIVIGLRLRRCEGWAFLNSQRLLNRLALLAGVLLLLALYDDSHYIDFFHYEPLVDPALHAHRGGIAMVDTYSQYGFLPWFIYYLVFSFMPQTFGSAAILQRVIDLAYFAVFLSMLFCVSRRRLSALWFFAPALLVAITSHDVGAQGMWNMHSLPMTLGGRWMIPASMALLLVVARREKWAHWTALGLIALSSLSAFEILAFTLAPWGYCLLLEAIRARSWKMLLRWGALAVLTVIATQLAFVACVFLFTGRLVNYAPYFDIVAQYEPTEKSFWSFPFVENYALWLPVCASYFMVAAIASWRALQRCSFGTLCDRLLPVAILGIGPLAYFFGRPQEATLNIGCLTFAVVAIGIAENLFVNAARFGPAGPRLAACLACAFAFIAADGFEHFMRPYDPIRGNATFLRRCFTNEGCHLSRAVENIRLALTAQPMDTRTDIGARMRMPSEFKESQRIEELTSMLRRLAPQTRNVGVITDYGYEFGGNSHSISVTAFMATGQWHAWSVSSPFYDGLSPILSAMILRNVAATPSGMLVVIANRRDGLAPLNQSILKTLYAHCRLSLVEADEFHSAFRTENCSK